MSLQRLGLVPRRAHPQAAAQAGSRFIRGVRSPKSRAGCHFAAAIGLRSMLEDFAPEIPGYALDMHTMKGKAMGRDLKHFRSESASWSRRRPPMTPMRTKPIGCGIKQRREITH